MRCGRWQRRRCQAKENVQSCAYWTGVERHFCDWDDSNYRNDEVVEDYWITRGTQNALCDL